MYIVKEKGDSLKITIIAAVIFETLVLYLMMFAVPYGVSQVHLLLVTLPMVAIIACIIKLNKSTTERTWR